MFKTTPFNASFRPDAVLRQFAHFEDPAPAPTPDPAPSPAPTPAVFTAEQQEAVNKLIGTARGEGKKTAMADFLKELGFDKPDDLKALITSKREEDEAKKTEADKLAEKLLKAEQRAQEAEDKAAQVEQQRVIDRRDSAIKGKAANAHDLDAVMEWAKRPANEALLTATVDADGALVEKSVDALIAAARKNAAYLFKAAGPGSPSLGGGRSVDSNDKDRQSAAQSTFNQLRGRL